MTSFFAFPTTSRRHSHRTLAVIALFVTAPLVAQVPTLPEPEPGQAPFPAEPQPSAAAVSTAWGERPVLASALPPEVAADDLIGREVVSSDGEDRGRLRDLVIDLGSGEINYAIVGSGGFLGLGETRRVVPMSALDKAAEEDGSIRLTLALAEEQWEHAPRYKDDELPQLAQPETRQRISAHYRSPGPAVTESASHAEAETIDRASPRQLVLASDLRGMRVQSQQEEIGRIGAVLVHVAAGDALVRLDPNASVLGTNSPFVLPLSQLSAADGEDDILVSRFGLLDFRRAVPGLPAAE